LVKRRWNEQAWPEPQWVQVSADEFAEAFDLIEPVAWLRRDGEKFECWRVIWGAADAILILFVPKLRRAGVVWGDARAEWADCESAQDALRRYLAGETTR
jgi:hypothetical protein